MITPEKRRTIVILISVVIILLLLFLLVGLFSGPKEAEVPEVETTPAQEVLEEADEVPVKTNTEVRLEAEQQERNEQSSVISLSKTFVERYGSYSTEANFQNLTDVLPLMSESFATTTRQFIANATTPTEYYGVSTDVITVTVESMDEEAGTASVLMNTQREEAKGSPGNTSVMYQEIRVTYVFESGAWKVNSADWL